MTNDDEALGHPFNVEVVRQIAEVMSKHDLSEVDLDTEAGRLRLRRGPRGLAATPMSVPTTLTTQSPISAATSGAVEPIKPSRPTLEVKSESIGTFYSRANPESEPYVKVGSRVTPTTVVGLIEAMKMFNEITAGVSGTIVEILVENQQAVEYGSVLFRIDPA